MIVTPETNVVQTKMHPGETKLVLLYMRYMHVVPQVKLNWCYYI